MKEPQPLDFEKPIVELQRRLQEIRDHSDEHAFDFDAEVEAMEAKIKTTRREIYDNLNAWQRVQANGYSATTRRCLAESRCWASTVAS